MCGRYTLYKIPSIQIIDKINPNYNIVPGDTVLLLNYKLTPFLCKWSIIPKWNPKIKISNIRLETLKYKDIFNNTRRCIFLANGYYEWKKVDNKKIPYYHTNNENLIYIAGVYDNSGASIITKESNGNAASIHTRQPVMLNKHELTKWVKDKEYYQFDCNISLKIYKVSLHVNRPSNNSFKNIVPII